LARHPVEPHIYVQKDLKDAYAMRIGDQVLIYEFHSGPTVKTDTGERLFRDRGAGAIVRAIEIVGDLKERPQSDAAPQYYVGRPPIEWKWKAAAKVIASGEVSRVRLNHELGYKSAYNFHGFGARGCGFKEIEVGQFNAILSILKSRITQVS
jgi:hypothetical protein